MIKLILILFTAISLETTAQFTHWNVCINNKIIVKGSDADINAKPETIQINRTDLKANTFLLIEMKEPASNITWKRDFIFSTKDEETLLLKKFEWSGGKFSIPFAEILPKTGKEKSIFLYTEQHPSNPDLGIRSKRALLAIFQLN
ncbi:MAG: hypothetical protein ACRC2O_03980 [Chitinophagaceae bacterium]